MFPGASRPFQGTPGVAGGLQDSLGQNRFGRKMGLAKPRTLGEAEISCGMVRLDKATHHGGGGRGGDGLGVAAAKWVCKGKVQGVFKGMDASAN